MEVQEQSKLLFSNRKLKSLIIPLVIEQTLLVAVSVTNTVMVSSLGEASVSAVSLVESINLLMVNIFTALATGGAVVIAQFLGNNIEKEARVAAKQLILITSLFSVIVALLALSFNQAILSLVFGRIEADVMGAAKGYFFISAFSYPFISLYNAGAAIFRAMGNSRVSMINSAIMNVINISLSAFLIFGLSWGVYGPATATLVARIISCFMILSMLRNKGHRVYIDNFFKYTWRPDYIKKILTIGIPSGLENSMFQLGKIMVQGIITTFGTSAIAANAVGATVTNIMIIPGMSLGLAMVTVVGQCVGANAYNQAVHYIKKILKIAYIATCGFNILICAMSPIIINLFGLSTEAANLAWQCLMVHGVIAIFIWPAAFTLPNALRAANDARFTMLVSVFSMWAFRYLFSFVLAVHLNLGLIGVWLAMTSDWLVRSIIFTCRYLSGKWKHRRLV